VLRFSILGTIEIYHKDKAARLTGVMQQTLLAAFLVSGGTLLTVDALMDELWGTTPPAKAGNALQAQVSRLRRCLGRLELDRTHSRLATTPVGYLFHLDRSELDAWQFIDEFDRIRLRAESEPGNVSELTAELRRALAGWRGPLFGGMVGGPICQTAAARYWESRNSALCLLYDLEIRSGRHAKILPELTELFANNASQEQLCMLLMIALYRSGRQTDALNVYRRLRAKLAGNLGIEPSPILRECERAILAHDPSLMEYQFSCLAIPEQRQLVDVSASTGRSPVSLALRFVP
jgi:DNA-binding SARP family transcriptional activator